MPPFLVTPNCGTSSEVSRHCVRPSVCLSVCMYVCDCFVRVCVPVMFAAELLPGLKMTLFNNWNLGVNMEKGTFTFPDFVALDAYWPGLLVSYVDTQFTSSLVSLACHWSSYCHLSQLNVLVSLACGTCLSLWCCSCACNV